MTHVYYTVRPRDTRPQAAQTSQVHVFELGPKKFEIRYFPQEESFSRASKRKILKSRNSQEDSQENSQEDSQEDSHEDSQEDSQEEFRCTAVHFLQTFLPFW